MKAAAQALRPLRLVLSEIGAGPKTAVIFDIDDTLLSTSNRQIRILREFAAENRGAQALAGVGREQLHYSVVETARGAGVKDAYLLHELKDFWRARFFTNEYLSADEPVDGAAEYCRQIESCGGEVIYLTGRDESMREGTLKSLHRHGFPAPKDGTLVLKPAFDAPDLEFKTEAAYRLGARPVAAAFENEPAHVNLFYRAFPQARLFLVETRHSGKPETPHASAHRIKDFIEP